MKTKFTQKEVDFYCEKYYIDKYFRESICVFPREISSDGIGLFLQKIRDLQEEFGEIEIGQDWYTSALKIFRHIPKDKRDLISEIKGRFKEEEERKESDFNCAVRTLRDFQKDYPELKITFTSEDEE